MSETDDPNSAPLPNDEPITAQDERFPVVGIGASAGGLEAFRQLLRHLPQDTGMAFVLIQHLNPDQKSILGEILTRETTMPVQEVQDGVTVEPNCVYVIPPNTTLTIAQGRLHLTPRDRTRKLAMPVDTFFFSLAEDQGGKAIAIVLSGGDGDGSRGLEAVKGAGGITFAQCKESAQVSSMPNTAVATGQVDFILPPQEIAEKLATISNHPYIIAPTPAEAIGAIPASETGLQTIFMLLRASTGVDFTLYKHSTLKRRILRRMVLYRLESLEDYVTYLREHPAEVQALYEDVLINVTCFFRDPLAFETLKSTVFPTLVNRVPGMPIRIWVAGCSTGEEAYSIAICLLEFLNDQPIKPPIQIYATDISDWAIEKARSGFYQQSLVGDVSPERLQRFFVPVEGGYQISKPVRELCVFAKQNLCSDPPFSRLDLISCRNVLIYLGTVLQKKILPTFHYGLKPTGFLMLGTSETTGETSDLFTLVDKKHKIYARKSSPVRLPLDLIANTYASEIADPVLRSHDSVPSEIDWQQAADRIVIERYAPVGVVVNQDLEILHFRGQTSPYLEPPAGRASFNLLRMAKEGLTLELRTAIHQAKQQDAPVRKEGVQIQDRGQIRQINLEIIPLKARGVEECHFLVLFEDSTPLLAASAIGSGPSHLPARDGSFLILLWWLLKGSLSKLVERTSTDPASSFNQPEIARLQQELATTQEYLRSIIEEQEATNQDLRVANEEILSSNEELQSSNEELETAKEEIQASNEELSVINDELQRRNFELTQISSDLQNLLSSINIPILMLSSDLRIRRFTPLAQSVLHLIPADIGRPFRDINLTLNLPDLEAQILEVMDTLTPKELEVQDQEGHWYDLRIRPYRTIDNRIDGAMVILVDIDALKRSMEQIEASRNYAQTIVETVREPLLVLDDRLQVITANQSFYQMFQTSKTETEQRSLFELGNGQWNIPQLRERLEKILPNNTRFQDFEVEHDFEQIGYKTMLLNARSMIQSDHCKSILLAIEDITERKRLGTELTQSLAQAQSARSAAESATRVKDEFLSMVSHELRTPLSAILGWVQLLRNQGLSMDKATQALEIIERSAKTQSQLIEDLLNISQIASGQLRLNMRPMQLAPMIAAAIDGVRVSAEAKQVQLISSLDPTAGLIMGDAMRLQQVTWNLLTNAIKFTPSGGQVTITLDNLNAQAQITVKDTGRGIRANCLPYVFDRFWQAESARTRSNPGLGLGLAIVRNLVELHGGTVEAESLGEGQGATFTVRLPLQPNLEETVDAFEANTPTNEIGESLQEIPSLVGVRVLLVDDEADMRQLFQVVLEQHGATVTAVSSAREAIAALTTNPENYDVLLSDMDMPQEDGYTLIRQVRSLDTRAGGQIPAAVLTALTGNEEEREAISAGFQRYISKSIEPNQLAIVVAALAGRISNE
ncbi:MAG: chemotaxis protein CheB [Elainellaceae cyanobacterium]